MGFRDESEALRQRIEMLRGELETERERLAETQAELGEQSALKDRIEELEKELAKHAPPPPPPKIEIPPHKKPPDHGQTVKIIAALGGTVAIVAGFALYEDGVFFASVIEISGSPTNGTIAIEAGHPESVEANVDGDIAGSTLSANCRGYFPARPLLIVRTSGPMTLRMSARSDVDTVLMVRGANQALHCDDDSGGDRNPRLEIPISAAGEHRVWVGTYTEDESADVTVTAEAVVAAASGVDFAGAPTIDTIEAANARVSGTASGQVSIQGCVGSYPVAPHVLLRLDEPRLVQLTTTTESGTDLVMALSTSDNTTYCDDDGAGSYMPLIARDLPAGDHRVWVGTYSGGTTAVPFELLVSSSARAAEAPPIEPQPEPEPEVETLTVDRELTREGTIAGARTTAELGRRCSGFMEQAPTLVVTLEAPLDVAIDLDADDLELVHHLPDGRTLCAPGDSSFYWTRGEHQLWIGAPTQEATPYRMRVRSSAPRR